jgi:hypothetical protein
MSVREHFKERWLVRAMDQGAMDGASGGSGRVEGAMDVASDGLQCNMKSDGWCKRWTREQ